MSTFNLRGSNSNHTNSYVDSTRASHLFITRPTHILHEMMGVTMVMVKTNKNAVSTIPRGPLGDIRTTNMMVNGKRMAEKFSLFPTFHDARCLSITTTFHVPQKPAEKVSKIPVNKAPSK